MSIKTKIIITKDHIFSAMKFLEKNDAISSYGLTHNEVTSNTVVFFLTSNLAHFHSTDSGGTWAHVEDVAGPYGQVLHISSDIISPRSVGQVNRSSEQSSVMSIIPKSVVMDHQSYLDEHPESKTIFAGCMVNNSTDEEYSKMKTESTDSGYVDHQRTNTKKRNMETYALIAEHDPSEDTNEDALNINWGDYESFKND